MGINSNFSTDKVLDKGTTKIRLINNRPSGRKITPNRRILFKKFNYEFRRVVESVAS